MSGETIRVSEIFGPTIQGEGLLIGRPTVFVRTGGCDFRCSWCDTPYAVDPAFRQQWREMSATEILARIGNLAGPEPLLISLSGGNPALQPMDRLLAHGRAAGYTFALETQGSIARDWFAALAFLTLSPKPPSSGMTTSREHLAACIAAAGRASVHLKFVVEGDPDYRFAREVAAWFPELPVTLQPCNPTPQEGEEHNAEEMYARLRRLVEKVASDRWYEARVLPQLHVLLWGNRRGV